MDPRCVYDTGFLQPLSRLAENSQNDGPGRITSKKKRCQKPSYERSWQPRLSFRVPPIQSAEALVALNSKLRWRPITGRLNQHGTQQTDTDIQPRQKCHNVF